MRELPGDLPVPEDHFLTREQAEADPTVDVNERPAIYGFWRRWRERRRRRGEADTP